MKIDYTKTGGVGYFEARAIGDEFVISISEESDFSVDGGYTFEIATNTDYLELDQAKELLEELTSFIERMEGLSK